MSKFNISKEFLIEKYIKNRKIGTEIAQEIGCNRQIIYYWMEHYKIKRRTNSEAKKGRNKGTASPIWKGDKAITRQTYYCKEKGCNNEITMQTALYGSGRCSSCATKTRKNHYSKWNKVLTKEFLIKEYVQKRKSSNYIAEVVGCSNDTIIRYIKKYKIKMRTSGESLKGIKFSKQHCENLSKAQTGKFGEKSNHYIDGRTPLFMMIRHLEESEEWRNEVFKKNNYTCQECGDNTGGNLNAHHKKHFAEILQEFLSEYDQFSPIEDKETLVRLAMKWQPFWDTNNGKTLCEDCHKKEYVNLNFKKPKQNKEEK